MIVELTFCVCGDGHTAETREELDEKCPVYETQTIPMTDLLSIHFLRINPRAVYDPGESDSLFAYSKEKTQKERHE